MSNMLVHVTGIHGGRDIEPSTSCLTIIISAIVEYRSDPTTDCANHIWTYAEKYYSDNSTVTYKNYSHSYFYYPRNFTFLYSSDSL